MANRTAQLRAAAAPAVLLVGFIILQARYLRPAMTEDAMNYFERAQQFPNLTPDHWSFRLGLIVPLRVLRAVFGESEVSYYTLPLVAGVVTVLSTFVIGRRLFSQSVGFGAAVIVMTSHWFLSYSSVPLPDHIATAWMLAALAIVLEVTERPLPWGRREHALLIVAGLLCGWAYLAREFIALLFPLVVMIFRSAKIPTAKMAYVASPAFALLVGELAFGLWQFANPVRRFMVAGSHGGQRAGILDSRWDAVARLPDTLTSFPGGRTLALLVIISPAVLLLRNRSGRLLFAWVALYWVPLTLASGLVEPSFRILKGFIIRYWTPILPAIALIALGLVYTAAAATTRRLPKKELSTRLSAVAVAACTALVASMSFSGVTASNLYVANGATQMRELREFLIHRPEASVIWTDSKTARILPIYTNSTAGASVWDGEIRAFNQGTDFVDQAAFGEGDLIVLYPFGYRAVVESWSEIPRYIRALQPGWRSVLQRDDDTLLVYEVLVRKPTSNSVAGP